MLARNVGVAGGGVSRRSFTSGRILEAVESASRHTQRVVLPEVDGLSKLHPLRNLNSVNRATAPLSFFIYFIRSRFGSLFSADVSAAIRRMCFTASAAA